VAWDDPDRLSEAVNSDRAAMLPRTGWTMIRPGSDFPPGPTDRRILLVDDNAPARNALSRILAREGYETTAVSDGRSALTAMNDGPVPAVVLTDMMLPDIDGRELARHASRLVPRPLVLLLTGWSHEIEGDDLVSWGIDAMFLKPLDLKGLLRTLREALDDSKV
jgi:CheY-like chemotaxis protein